MRILTEEYPISLSLNEKPGCHMKTNLITLKHIEKTKQACPAKSDFSKKFKN